MRKGILLLSLFLTAGCATTRRQATETPATPAPAAQNTVAVPDLCTELGTPGAVPTIPLAGRPLRVLAFGDYGDGSASQRQTAEAMVRYDRDHPFDLGLTLGDNFYPQGLNDPASPRWDTEWESLYNPLGIRLYATFGNHDYYDRTSPPAEIARSGRSRSWCMPRAYYTFAAGPVQFFALDTDPIEKGEASVAAQLDWLRGALQASQARWKVVYGHHPIYTNGEHGDERGYLPALRDRLFPILRDQKVDVYLAGHDHDLESLKPLGGVSFFVSGGGGKEKRPLQTSQCRSWAESSYGFTVLEATDDELTVRFLDSTGRSLHETTLRKGEPVEDCPRS
jgi:tartrate-resistant acid phosphatase type 5